MRSKMVSSLVAVALLALAIVAFRWWPRSVAAPPTDGGTSTPSSREVDPEVEADFVPNGSIEGVVLTEGGTPAVGAAVAVHAERTRRATTTDDQGRFTVAALRPGPFDVSATDPAGGAATSKLNVKAGTATRIDLRLAKVVDAVTLAGRVRDVLGGPVGTGEVWIGSEDLGSAITVVRTMATGQFTARVSRGSHEVRVRAAGYAEAAEHIDLGGDLVVDLVVNPAASIRGIVVTADGKPVPKVLVRADSRASIGPTETTTDDEGHFELQGLPSASFDIVATTPTDAGRVLGVNVVPTMTRDVQIEIRPAASVSGVVQSEKGEALVGAEVTLEIDGDRSRETAKTGVDGRYLFASVPRGTVVVGACAAKHSCGSSKARAAAAGTRTEIDLSLNAGTSFRIRVLGAGEAPVQGADAFLSDFHGCRTDADGTCSIDHVSVRKSKLRIHHVTAGYYDEAVEIGAGDSEHLIRLQPGATVRGTVRWEDGPVATDVAVYAGRIVGRTDHSGRYELRNVEPGYLDVGAEAALEVGMRGMQQRTERLWLRSGFERIKAGEVRDPVDLTLQRKAKTISGTVVAADATPVAYAEVGLAVDDPDAPWSSARAGASAHDTPTTYAGADGKFSIESVAKGRYVVWARSTEHPVGRVKGVDADTHDVKVALPPGASIEGEVRDARGASIPEFVVLGDRHPLRISDPNGRFTLRGLAAGSHELVVETDPPQRRSARIRAKVGAGERSKLTIVLNQAVTITGRVVAWPDMKPRAGIRLDVHGPGRRTSPPTGADGRFEMEDVPEGEVELWTWDAEGEQEDWKRPVVAAGARADLGDLAFAPGRKYAHPFAYESDGKRAVTTGRGNPGGIDVKEGDEVVSVGGVPVATLTNASLAAVCAASGPDVPIVVKRKGESATTTVHRKPQRRRPENDD